MHEFFVHMMVREENAIGEFWPKAIKVVAHDETEARHIAIPIAREKYGLETYAVREVARV